MTGALILKLGVIQTKTPARGPHVIFFHNCQFSDLIGNPNLSKLAPVKNCWDSPLVKTTLKPSTKSKIPSCQFGVNYGLIVSTVLLGYHIHFSKSPILSFTLTDYCQLFQLSEISSPERERERERAVSERGEKEINHKIWY